MQKLTLPQCERRGRICITSGAQAFAPVLGFDVIDPDGYRPNVGIILIEEKLGRVFWARRIGHDGWQFPQGGMNSDETPLEAMYRELQEETGLIADDVEVLSATPGWLKYRLPERYIRHRERPVCVGQKQVWFLLKLVCEESRFKLDATDAPEFDGWRWVDFWYPLSNVVSFKRRVYERALQHFLPAARSLALAPIDERGPEQTAFRFYESA